MDGEGGSSSSTDPTVATSIPITSEPRARGLKAMINVWSATAFFEFTQQSVPAWKPVLTPAWAIAAFFLLGLVCIPIGIVTLRTSRDVVEIVDRYDTECVPEAFKANKVSYIKDSSVPKTCSRVLKVHKYMKAPIYIYYQLDNYYQNHRRYVKSRSDKQLLHGLQYNDTSDCKPEDSNGGLPIVPCGLIAWSLFNDTYKFIRGTEELVVNRKDISWKSDRDHKFGKHVFPFNFQNGSLIGGGNLDPSIPHQYFCGFSVLKIFPVHKFLFASIMSTFTFQSPASPVVLSDQEDLIVWMRTAALPSFRKLYGRIEHDLEAEDVIVVQLMNNYNTYSFRGRKKIVLSTSSWLGGRNDFLGVAYIFVGSSSIIISMIFMLLHLKYPRSYGDTTYLPWNRKGVPS